MHPDIIEAWLSDLVTTTTTTASPPPSPPVGFQDKHQRRQPTKGPRRILASIDPAVNSARESGNNDQGQLGGQNHLRARKNVSVPQPASDRARTPSPRKPNVLTRAAARQAAELSKEAQEEEQEKEQVNNREKVGRTAIRGRQVSIRTRTRYHHGSIEDNIEEQIWVDDDNALDVEVEEQEEEEPGEEKTPRADKSNRISSSSLGTITAHSNAFGHPLSASASSSARSSRSGSRFESGLDLLFFERPVHLCTHLSSEECRHRIEKAHPEFLTTFDQIERILFGDTPFLPGQLRNELRHDNSMPRQPDSAYINHDRGDDNNPETLLRLQFDLQEIRDIVSSTRQSLMLLRAAPAWNDLVHSRVLRLATRRTKTVQAENMTRATIARPYVPIGASPNAAMSSKTIDYALAFECQHKDPFSRHLSMFLRQASPDFPMINQTTYNPLLFAPTGVFIETMDIHSNPLKGLTQLGLWVASWYKRIELLTGSRLRLPILPLLLVETEKWELLFACHQGDKIRIVGSLLLGSTTSLDGVYRIIAIVEVLATWVERDFRTWIEEAVGYKATKVEESVA